MPCFLAVFKLMTSSNFLGRSTGMIQRWLAAFLLHCEEGVKRIKGYADIPAVVAAIEAEQAGDPQRVRPAA